MIIVNQIQEEQKHLEWSHCTSIKYKQIRLFKQMSINLSCSKKEFNSIFTSSVHLPEENIHQSEPSQHYAL